MSVVDRPALSRDLIAATALQLIDSNGLSGMSMRKLGAELGVEAMSLYHYVKNKDDLLDAVLDLLYKEIALPEVSDREWEKAIRLGLVAFRDVLVEHQAAIELFTSRPAKSEAAVRVLHWAHQRFMAVGLTLEDAHNALHLAVSFVMGHVANELGAMSAPAEPVEVNVSDPELVAFLDHAQHITGDEMFAVGLDVIVAGLRHTYRLP